MPNPFRSARVRQEVADLEVTPRVPPGLHTPAASVRGPSPRATDSNVEIVDLVSMEGEDDDSANGEGDTPSADHDTSNEVWLISPSVCIQAWP